MRGIRNVSSTISGTFTSGTFHRAHAMVLCTPEPLCVRFPLARVTAFPTLSVLVSSSLVDTQQKPAEQITQE